MKKILFGFFLMLTYIFVQAQAYYIAPTGNDNNPGTLAAPFFTLEKARTAMRGSSTKTTYLRAGTYPRSEVFILGQVDNGTTWQRYSGDAWNSVIIDGNGIADIIAILGGSNITIDGLTVRNFTARGIGVKGGSMWALAPNYDAKVGTASGNVIKNNIVENGVIPGKGWNMGAIFGWGDIPNTTFSHNLIRNTTGYGIGVWNQQETATLSNLMVSDNILYNVFRGGTCYDGAAIYILEYKQLSNPIKVKNNFIRDFGTRDNMCWGIYLDDNLSNVEVSGNVIGGEGGKPVHIHGGRNNTVTGNIFDNQNKLTEVISYGKSSSTNAMSGNVISNNIILSRVNSTFICYSNGTGDQFPEIKNNFYKNYGTAAISSSGKNGLTDSNPVAGDPMISGASTWDIASGSPVFASPVSFPPLTKGWGPAGYNIPADFGSVPSFVDAAVTGLSINPASTFLAVGGKQLVFANTIPWNASNQSISNWSSSNTSVATISSTGLITGVSAGTATITATSQDGNKTGTCTVTVLAGITNVALNKVTTTSGAYTGRGGNWAVDGDNTPTSGSKSWFSGSTPSASAPHWIEINLAASYSISHIKLWTGDLNVYSTPLRSFQLQYWNGSAWQDIISETEKFITMYSKEFPAVTTSKIRLYVTDCVNWVKLFEIEVYGSALTGINDLKKGDQIKMFPNPLSTGDLTISFDGNSETEDQNVLICDISGRTVYQKQLEKVPPKESITISRNVFTTKGVYLVRGFCGNKLNGVAKLLVE